LQDFQGITAAGVSRAPYDMRFVKPKRSFIMLEEKRGGGSLIGEEVLAQKN
jgi:hypothetical protein